MNRMQQINPNEINQKGTVSTFREEQYSLIKYFCFVCVNYLSKMGNDDIRVKSIDINENVEYHGIYNSITEDVIVYTENSNKPFFKIMFPSLIDGTFFYIGGNYYVPRMYVIDYPVSLKEDSIQLQGIINGLTIWIPQDIVTLIREEIPIKYFASAIFYNDQEGKELIEELMNSYKRPITFESDENVLNYFENKFDFKRDYETILASIENLIFDDYTRKLYEACYGTSKISLIIKKALYDFINNNKPNYVDLSNKRLCFIELLMQPLFERIAGIARQVRMGFKCNEIVFDKSIIIKRFRTPADKKKKRKGLSGNVLYDQSNLFSSILKYKVSMIAPGVEEPPKEVQTIHPSHFGRLCLITISSENPGQVMSMLPMVKVDKFGRFM